MASLYVEAFTEPPRKESWSSDQAQAQLEDYFDHGLIAVEKSAEGISGFGLTVLEDNAAHLELLAVKKQHRGTGLGRRLIESRLNELMDLGYFPDMVLTETRADTPAVIALTEAYGFLPIDRYGADYGGDNAERILWQGSAPIL